MKRTLRFALLATLAACAATFAGGQSTGRVVYGDGVPGTSNPDCSQTRVYINSLNGDLYTATGVGAACSWVKTGSSSGTYFPGTPTVTMSGTPAAGKVATATSGTTGDWETPSGGGGGSATLPAGFPNQLQGFTGPVSAFVPDGLSWDAYGIGGPSNTIFFKGEYWMAVAGYSSSDFASAQAIGLWHGPDLSQMVPYSGNPVITNTTPAWAAACIEGPDLNVDASGNIYISFLGFSSACDGEGTGSIGIVSTSAASFPTGWSSMPSSATIPQPANLNWLYRPFIIEIGGVCYDYSNGGDTSNNPKIFSFHTTGPCASTETVAADWTSTATTVFGATQTWEGSGQELQDPQVFQDPSGMYIMVYSVFQPRQFGYATTLTPAANNWVKNSSNPAYAAGVNCSSPWYGVGCGPYLARLTMDSSGEYWAFADFNNSPAMNLYKAGGPVGLNSPPVLPNLYDQSPVIVAATSGLTSAGGSASCVSTSCTSLRGTVGVVAGSFNTGAAFEVSWANATPTDLNCQVAQGGGTLYGGYGLYVAAGPTGGWEAGPGVSISGTTTYVQYLCVP